MKCSYWITLLIVSIISIFPVHAAGDVELEVIKIEANSGGVSAHPKNAKNLTKKQKKSSKRCTTRKAGIATIALITAFSAIPDLAVNQTLNNLIVTGPVQTYSDFEVQNSLYDLINYQRGCSYIRPKSEENISPLAANKEACVCPKNESCKCIVVNCDKDGKFEESYGTLYFMSSFSLVAKSIAVVLLTAAACSIS